MEFSYDVYYKTNFILPLFFVITSSAWLVGAMVFQFREIRRRKVTTEFLVTMLAAIAIGGFFMTLNIRTLFQGGIYLCTEKESDAIVSHVVIDRIEPCDSYDNHKYGTGDGTGAGTSYGVKITAGGNYYNAVSSGDLQPGDDALITYLPKSRVVLRIDPNP